ncbi:probable serine/threonine-protein kinase vps15 [Drosophila tropicalis]|uniref:probable serine/threonine-protein kinase vps15 n=1 Tax=Drosophila tropicalis TaxID=46794 RepID=UPI0035AB98EA
MAPFKLKFRMGSSRSTSQEHDPDPQVNEALLGAQQQQEQQQQHQHQEQQQQQQQQQHHQAAASSSSTLDSADCSSLGSMSSERKLLLPPNKTSSSSVLNSNSLRLGYINQSRTPCINESPTDTDTANLPTTPPPSYEHVLEENTRLSQHQRQLSTDSAATPNQNSRRSSANSSRHSAAQLSAALEQHLGSVGGAGGGSSDSSICNDPDCQQNINQNYGNCGSGHLIASNNNSLHNNNNNEGEQQQIIEGVTELELHSDNDDYDCQEVDNTLSVSEFLLETEMAAATSGCDDKGFGETGDGQCTDAQCTQCGGEDGCNTNDNGENESAVNGEEGGGASTSSHAARQSFYDPLLNRGNYGNYSEAASAKGASSSGQVCQEACCAQGTASGLGRKHQQQQQQATCHSNLLQSPEMMSNKTSKEIYKDLAKQWGITCKMSESCRCMECQSHYFDCDYDDNEHQKTDGGLGAGTPMFISEVMHGSGCNIL